MSIGRASLSFSVQERMGEGEGEDDPASEDGKRVDGAASENKGEGVDVSISEDAEEGVDASIMGDGTGAEGTKALM